jgi:hypothetical protein
LSWLKIIKKYNFFFTGTFPMMIVCLIGLIKVWNTDQQWRFNLALIAFIIFAVMTLLHAYVVYFRKNKTKGPSVIKK